METRILAKKNSLTISILALCVIIFIGGYVYYNYEKNSILNNKYKELKTISDYKSKNITEWFKARKSQITIVASSALFKKAIENYVHPTSVVGGKTEIINSLKPIIAEYGLENIILTDTTGDIIVTANKGLLTLSDFAITKINEAVSSEKIISSDLYFCKVHKRIHIDFIAPIMDDQKNVFSVLIFRDNPAHEIFPIINYYNNLINSLETVVLRLEEDSILIINDTRFGKNTAFNLRIPLTRKEHPAVAAASGLVGQFEGIDYMNVEVLADIKRLTNPDWIVVTKIDKSEINAELIEKSYYILALCLGLTFTVGFGFIGFYNQRQKSIYEELYKKEKELWLHQEKFKVTIDGLGDGLIITDMKGIITYLNKRAEELTGWRQREAQGRNLSEIYSVKNEETGQKEDKILEKVLKHGIVKELANHTILISKDGKEIPVMDTGAPIYDIDGTLQSIAISFQDETEKRQQLNLIKESEYRLRSTLDNMLEGCQIIGSDWKYQYINKTAEKHNRRPNSELLGKHYVEMWPGVEHTEIYKIMKKCMEERIPNSLENEFIFPDGSNGYFELTVEPIPEGIFILSIDITERIRNEFKRQKTEKELLESHKKINKIISDLHDVYWTASVDGSNIVEVSKFFEKLYGYSEEQLRKNPNFWMEVVHPEDKEIALKSGDELLKNGKAEAEYRIVRPDGSIRWILDRKSVIKDEEGKVIQIGGITKDITERKLAVEEIIKAKDKAEELNRLKSNFFANMSHELRTPFIGIMGFAEIISQNLQGTENGDFADSILRSSERLIRTLNQILSTSKLEYEERKVVTSTVDLEMLLLRVFKNYSKIAEYNKLAYEINISFKNYLAITDEELLEQILSNLISNATKFTKNGNVSVFADILNKNNKELLKVEVTDTGIGIAKNHQEIIWDHFRQASEGLNRSFEGTGLGLSIVRSNTKLLGGTISLESDEGKGATFIVEIPLIKSVGLRAQTNKVDTIPKSTAVLPKVERDDRKKILYVEDDKFAIAVITKFISSKYEITTADNAEEAVRIVAVERFDLVLMDINLGKGMDGVELSQLINKVPGYENVPIVAITAFARDEERIEFLSKGMSHYISKPFRQNDLLELLHNIFTK